MTGWLYLPTARLLPLAGAVVFGVFFIVAFVLRQAGVGDDVTVRVAGGLAYAFLAFAAAVAITAPTRSRERARRVAVAALTHEQALITRLGSPLTARVRPGGAPPRDGSPWALTVDMEGPLDTDTVQASMVRERGDWALSGWERTAAV